jgi:hypothetical protein
MQTAICISILVFIFSCKETLYNKDPTNEIKTHEESITSILTRMYEHDRTKNDLLNDRSLFSEEIVELNEKCNRVTKNDIDRISKSPYPTDKPRLREGSSVTSLYEGATEFEIKQIMVNDKQTEVTVVVSNKNDNEVFQWEDKVILINEDGLKIDNVYFDKNVYSSSSKEPNLKEYLTNFSNQKIPIE